MDKPKPAKVRFVGTAAQMAAFEQHNHQLIAGRTKIQVNDATGCGRRYYTMAIAARKK